MTVQPTSDADFFELRIYEAMPDRLSVLHQRMGHDVGAAFERAGVPHPVGHWDCHLGPGAPLYVYMLRWRDLDERMAAFGRFYQDPEWHAMYAGGPTITSMDVCIMRATLLPQPASAAPAGPIHEMRFYNFTTLDAAAGDQVVREVEVPHLEAYGAVTLGAFEVVFGACTPRGVLMMAWNSHAERRSALEAWESDPCLRKGRAERYAKGGRPIVRDLTTYLLRPAPYSSPAPGFPGGGNG